MLPLAPASAESANASLRTENASAHFGHRQRLNAVPDIGRFPSVLDHRDELVEVVQMQLSADGVANRDLGVREGHAEVDEFGRSFCNSGQKSRLKPS